MIGSDGEAIGHALDALLPMHAYLGPDARIRHLGPTLGRLAGGRLEIGRSVFDGLSVLRPRQVDGPDSLLGAQGRRLYLQFLEPPAQHLVAHVVQLGDGVVLDLSLALKSLARFGSTTLSATDFSPTDSIIDVLYLLEARKIAMAEVGRLVKRLQGARWRAETAAHTDTLTGLRNRRALDNVMGDVRASGQPYSICQVDLDYFKDINDTHGHAAGDQVLRVVAKRLTATVRATDTVARVGGDEFTLVFPGLVDRERLTLIGDRIVSELELPITVDGHACRLSASLGISLSTEYESADPERLIEDADRALYRSKSAGRARCTVHSPSNHV